MGVVSFNKFLHCVKTEKQENTKSLKHVEIKVQLIKCKTPFSPYLPKINSLRSDFQIADNDDCVYGSEVACLPLPSLPACTQHLEIKQKHIELATLAVATLER